MAVRKSDNAAWELKLHDSGNDVKKVQQMLAKLGSKVAVNGEYTIGMMSAVKSFQRKNGLPDTGIINKKTWDKLVAATTMASRVVKRVAKK